MAVQINEVIIRAVVETNSQSATSSSAPASGGLVGEHEIAEKILEIIREKTER